MKASESELNNSFTGASEYPKFTELFSLANFQNRCLAMVTGPLVFGDTFLKPLLCPEQDI